MDMAEENKALLDLITVVQLPGTIDEVDEIIRDGKKFYQDAHDRATAEEKKKGVKFLVFGFDLPDPSLIFNLFAPGAVEAIFAFSNGLPRLINLLAEKSLLVGCQKQVKAIDSEVLQLAQEDLDFLSPRPSGNN